MNRRRFLCSLLAGTFAFALVLLITQPAGPGLDPDAMSYMFSATTLVQRGAFLDVRDEWVSTDSTRKYTRWPPAFPTAIAATVAVGMRPVQGGRLVMAFAAAITFAVLGWVMSDALGLGAAIAFLLLLAVTPAMALVHESVLSEPMFLAALCVTLWAMARERAAPLASGTSAAVASMVRYAGLGAVGAAVLWEFLRRGNARERITRAAVAAAPAIALNVWWWARASRGAVRKFQLYGQLGPTLREGGATTTRWLAPGVDGPWSTWVAIVVLAAALAVITHGARRAARDDAQSWRVIRAAALVTLGYAGLVIVARVIADPDIPLDERLLAPAMLFVSVIAAVAIAAWWSGAARGARIVAGLVIALWGAGSLWVSLDSVRYNIETGSDYADRCWVESPVTQWVRDHGEGHALFSNANVALFFQAHRLAREAPDDDVIPDSARMFVDTLAARRGFVVLYDQSCATTIEPKDTLMTQLGLQMIERLPTGTIWSAPATPQTTSAPR